MYQTKSATEPMVPPLNEPNLYFCTNFVLEDLLLKIYNNIAIVMIYHRPLKLQK